MHEPPLTQRRLLIVDDDAMCRDLLSLLAADDGFHASTFDSGEALLEFLDEGAEPPPDAILVDMQMPGVCGDALARLLRRACAAETVLLAMSATAVPAERRTSFDAFLLKPFAIEQVRAACDNNPAPNATASHPDSVLSAPIYEALAQSMPADQLRKLYLMCLDDADSRLAQMRITSAARDADAYRRGAHSIKGGCGMVGALELAAIASAMEETGLPDVGDQATFEQFLTASHRLRRILDAP